MKYACYTFALLLVCLIRPVLSQGTRIDYFPDSVRIELPQHESLVVLELKSYSTDNELVKSFPQFLGSLLTHVEKSMSSDFRETGPYSIDVTLTHQDEDQIAGFYDYNFRPIGEKTLITITKEDVVQTHVTVKKDQIVELKPPGWYLTIHTKRFQASVYTTSYDGFTKISKEDFANIQNRITSAIGTTSLRRKSIRSRVVMRDGNITQDTTSFFHPLDMLSINVEGGVGVLQTRIYPHLSATVGIWLNDRYNRPRTKFQIDYDNMFFADSQPEGGYKSHINSFLSFSIGKNFNRGHGRPSWTGIGAGFLVRKSGDYFEGNTLKLFLFNDIGSSRVQLVPEFYLTDDFRKFNFGMKLKYVF